MNQDRLRRLTEQIAAHGLDGLALMPGPNLLYVSGIHTHVSERPILLFIPADDEPAIIIPTLEAMKARDAGIAEDRIFDWNDAEGYAAAFQQACARLELADYLLGVEALHMRVLELQLLQRYAPGLQVAHAEPALSALRMVKDAAEIAAMEKAIDITERALKRIVPRIKVGLSERQVAAMLTQELLASGADSIAFGPIVSTGPNSASPHATPTDRKLQRGDLLVIDWGVYVDDYPSDLTRTFAVGPIDDELRHIYEVVRLANEAGRAAARPGVTGQMVDREARDVIEDAGYGDYFIHRTGHGLGLEIHEPPDMSPTNTKPLAPGNVFTIEPGIYLPGRGGVRIEDNVVVTTDGCRTLSSFPRELITVG
ncbi:M24 family metallopeptidase [Promineifilum sp.]|uniref:M24 family metallopeptidase n=1 Tax=Promineifilum sp. TaxID=2664178 RepID=UPI0035B0021D